MGANVIAIIADIVDSKRIARRAEFQRSLKVVLARVSKRSHKHLLSPFTLTLGDEFQAVYARFDSLFADILQIALEIYPEPVRYAIACGPLSTDINTRAALEMDGRAFHDARDLLSALKKEKRTIIQIKTTGLFDPSLVDISLRLFCNELETWNRNTYSIFLTLVEGASVGVAANRASVTRRAAYKAIARHHLRDLHDLLKTLTNELTHGLHVHGGE